MCKYLTDINLSDSEARLMCILDFLLKENDFIHELNREIGSYLGKSENAVSKLLWQLSKKGYTKSVGTNISRKLYILK